MMTIEIINGDELVDNEIDRQTMREVKKMGGNYYNILIHPNSLC